MFVSRLLKSMQLLRPRGWLAVLGWATRRLCDERLLAVQSKEKGRDVFFMDHAFRLCNPFLTLTLKFQSCFTVAYPLVQHLKLQDFVRHGHLYTVVNPIVTSTVTAYDYWY